MNSRYGCAVTVADQDTVCESDGIQNFRKHRHGLTGHIVKRARQRAGIGASIPRAGIGKHATSRFSEELLWKIAPEINTAEAFMEEHKRRRLSRRRADRIGLQQRTTGLHAACSACFIPEICLTGHYVLIWILHRIAATNPAT